MSKSKHLRECRQSRSTLRKVDAIVALMKARDAYWRSQRMRWSRLPMPGEISRHGRAAA